MSRMTAVCTRSPPWMSLALLTSAMKPVPSLRRARITLAPVGTVPLASPLANRPICRASVLSAPSPSPCGISSSSGCPMACSATQPKIRSAAGLNSTMRRSLSNDTIASAAICSTSRKRASARCRNSFSRVISRLAAAALVKMPNSWIWPSANVWRRRMQLTLSTPTSRLRTLIGIDSADWIAGSGNSGAQAGSNVLPCNTRGIWCAATQPAAPWPIGTRVPRSDSRPAPRTAAISRCRPSSASSMIEALSPSNWAIAASMIRSSNAAGSSVWAIAWFNSWIATWSRNARFSSRKRRTPSARASTGNSVLSLIGLST